jgi:hypothetical protein
MKAASRLATLLMVTAAGVAAGLAGAGPASAHEGEGVVTVEAADQAEGATAIHYVVRLTWENDGHAALDATFTATVLGPDGAAAGGAPVTLTPSDQDGRYEGDVTFPEAGDWTVRFVAVEPATELDRAQPVSVPVTTAAPTTTTTVAETTTTEAEPVDTDETAATEEEDDDSSFPVVPVAIVVVLAALGGAAFAITRRKSAGGTGTSTGTDV